MKINITDDPEFVALKKQVEDSIEENKKIIKNAEFQILYQKELLFSKYHELIRRYRGY